MDTLLTLEEVSKYLRVSERTVKAWATSGKLPGGKLGGSWRFRQGDIQEWVNKQLTPHKHSRALQGEYSIRTLLKPSRIYITNFSTKEEFLDFFIKKGASVPGVSEEAEIAEAVYKRENLMSTGIGLNIAVPHVRLNEVKSLNIFFAVNSLDIKDYASLDNLPVRIGIFFVVGRNQHSEYIKALSVLVERLKNHLIHEQVLQARSEKDIYDSLVQGDL
jgi:PTS system nitrogen regulatory IIA component